VILCAPSAKLVARSNVNIHRAGPSHRRPGRRGRTSASSFASYQRGFGRTRAAHPNVNMSPPRAASPRSLGQSKRCRPPRWTHRALRLRPFKGASAHRQPGPELQGLTPHHQPCAGGPEAPGRDRARTVQHNGALRDLLTPTAAAARRTSATDAVDQYASPRPFARAGRHQADRPRSLLFFAGLVAWSRPRPQFRSLNRPSAGGGLRLTAMGS